MTLKPTLIALLLAAAGPAFAQACATVEVDNVRPQQGHLMVAAFGSAETYGKTPLVSLRLGGGIQVGGVHGAVTCFMNFAWPRPAVRFEVL